MTKANPTVVGGFVVGAIALMIAGVLFFGSASMFAPKVPVVMYFTGSVEGLNTGAVIEFSGVQLGTVTGVTAEVQPDLSIQVVVDGELNPSAVSLGKGVAEPGTPGENFARFIEKGIRAQLTTGSLLTGQKIVSLAFLPDEPAVMRGPNAGEYEIPTVPSEFDVYKAEIADTLLNVFEMCDRRLPPSVRSEPHIRMMMYCVRQHLCDDPPSISSTCYASGQPMTTALRRLHELVSAGMFVKSADDSDKRRSVVRPTADLLSRLERLGSASSRVNRALLQLDVPRRQAGGVGVDRAQRSIKDVPTPRSA